MLGERPDDFEYVQGPAAFLEAQICKGSKTYVVRPYLGCTARNSACNDWNPCIRRYVCQDNVASNPSGTPGLRSQWLSFLARGKSRRNNRRLAGDCAGAVGCASIEPGKNAQNAQSPDTTSGKMSSRTNRAERPALSAVEGSTVEGSPMFAPARNSRPRPSHLQPPEPSAPTTDFQPQAPNLQPPEAVSPLEYALTKNAPVSPLECALTKIKDLKPPEMNTYRKTRVGGSPVALHRAWSGFKVRQKE